MNKVILFYSLSAVKLVLFFWVYTSWNLVMIHLFLPKVLMLDIDCSHWDISLQKKKGIYHFFDKIFWCKPKSSSSLQAKRIGEGEVCDTKQSVKSETDTSRRIQKQQRHILVSLHMLKIGFKTSHRMLSWDAV